ncbi:MAG: glutamate--tRNA ligase family protein [Planctomycetota bacterium]
MADPPPSNPVVTRFAPSPTGELHIGGARTALFAWAYARRHGGKFLLRFEDTDRKRSSKQAEQNILRDLEWLGLRGDNHDSIPRQSERLDLYNAALDKMKAAGRTYEDDGAVRFRMDKPVVFDDEVYGRIEVGADDLEDFVIRKADGFPTFHLAVVVDDAEMGVTHVIRGQEHLSNTAKHAALYDALGEPRPVWCHTPSIMNPDGSKMSKRDKFKFAKTLVQKNVIGKPDLEKSLLLSYSSRAEVSRTLQGNVSELVEEFANDLRFPVIIADLFDAHLPEVSVDDFRRSGHIVSVLLNYLALLGWNPGNDLERFDLDYLCEHFDFGRIGKSNSKFDRDKLAAFSQDTILQMPLETWAQRVREFFEQHHPAYVERLGEHFDLFAEAYRERSKTLADPATLGRFFFEVPEEYNPKAVKKNLTKNDGEGLANLRHVRDTLAALDEWSAAATHAALDALSRELGLKNMGGVAQPLRVALTGAAVSPEIGPTLVILGRDETLRRIDACLAAVSTDA